MKRLLTVMIAVCYLCICTGITVHIHYCMGRIVEASLWKQDDSHHCSHCGMIKKSSGNDCCKDEHKVLKKATDQLTAKDVVIKVQFTGYMLPVKPDILIPDTVPVFYVNRMAQAHAPPLIVSGCPIYIRVGNLRV